MTHDLFFFSNMILLYTFLPWRSWNVIEMIYFSAQKERWTFSLNKGHSVQMLHLSGRSFELLTKMKLRLENNCFNVDILQSIYRSICFYIHQITVISVTIQNIWTKENSCWWTSNATVTVYCSEGWMVIIGNAFCGKCIYNLGAWHGSEQKTVRCHF